jgi:hypothetical protein
LRNIRRFGSVIVVFSVSQKGADTLELDVEAILRESLDPGMSMGIVAVNERTVDIQEHSANRAHFE